MNDVTGSNSRRLQQGKSQGFKTKKLVEGTVLNILEYKTRDTKGDNPQPIDVLICENTTSNRRMNLSVAEFNKLIGADDAPMVKILEDGNVLYPKSIAVKSSKDRLGVDDKPFFAAYAYVDADDFYDRIGTDDEMSWDDLKESGVKEGDFDHVQTYTVVPQH